MRLIDADNVNFHCNYDGDCTGDIYSCKECENYICDFRDIQEQPIAYDIDKVVEELEEMKAYREIGTVEECKGCVIEILKAYNKALDDVYEILLEEAPRNYAGELEFGGSVKYLSANGAHKIVKKLKNRLVDLCKEVLDEQTIGGKKSNE